MSFRYLVKWFLFIRQFNGWQRLAFDRGREIGGGPIRSTLTVSRYIERPMSHSVC